MIWNRNSNSAQLIDAVFSTKKVSEIKKILKHALVDVNILESVMEHAKSFCSVEQNEIFCEVMKSNKVTPNILVDIVNRGTYRTVKKAIRNANADKTVLDSAMERTHNMFSTKDRNEVYCEVIESNYVTSDMLEDIASKCSFETMIKVVKHKKTDKSILDGIVERVRITFTGISRNEIFCEVMKSNYVTSDMLEDIVKSGNLDTILKAIKHEKSDEKVLNRALLDAEDYFVDEVAREKFLDEIATKRNQIQTRMDDLCKEPMTQNQDGRDTMAPQVIFQSEFEDHVIDRIRMNVEDGMSTMLWGLSGVGKTSHVREIDPTFTMIKLKNDMLPEEVIGRKGPNGLPGEMYPPKWYVKLCQKCEEEPDRMHILLIDEITNVKNNVKSLVWDIIEERRVNGDEDWQLPDNCAIVAAGNYPEKSTSVIADCNDGVLPEPLHDKFDFYIDIPFDMRKWQQWALKTDPKTGFLNIHPSVLSFCSSHAKEVMFRNLNVEDVTQPRLSPRRWAKLSKAMYMAERRGGKTCHVSEQRIAECIGKDFAQVFIEYYEKPPLDMKKVENGQYQPGDFSNIDDKLFAISSLIGSDVNNEVAVVDFIEYCLGDDFLAIYEEMKKQRNEVMTDMSNKKAHTIQKTLRK